MSEVLRDALRGGPRDLLQRLVDQAVLAVDGADGAALEVVDDEVHLTYVATSGALAGSAGLRLRYENSLSGLAMIARRPMYSADVHDDDRVDRAACDRLGIRSMVCLPLHRHERPVGVLKVSSTRPHAFGDHDIHVLDEIAAFVTTLAIAAWDLAADAAVLEASTLVASMSADDPSARTVQTARRFVEGVLRTTESEHDRDLHRRISQLIVQPHRFEVLYQPIYDLGTRRMVGVEALSRFPTLERPPDVVFALAHGVGLGVELEIAALGVAIDGLAALPPDLYLAVNVGPEALADPDFLPLVADCAPRLVVELTEHERIDGLGVVEQRRAIHALGARFATDDTGAGFSGLTRVIQLQPDVIKLDREITASIEDDLARRAMAAAIVTFASRTGTTVVAEGIENEAALGALVDAGIQFGQGYHLARPMPLSAVCVLRRNECRPRRAATGTPHARHREG
jgi:EAL domain-containing protein (putative c-di-GMP-specific phosphodiesterase class I)